MTTDKEHWNCKDCGKDTSIDPKDYYMVKHWLWNVYGAGEDMLCITCMETRLGRKLRAVDILPCPLTEVLNPYTKLILNKWERKNIEISK